MFVTTVLTASTETVVEGAEHAAEHGAAAGGVFPPFDPSSFASQLLWLAITFGIFYYVVSKVIIPRLSGILGTRRDRISRDLDEAQRMKEESDAALAAYEQELAEARRSAGQIAQEARDKAKAEADARRGEAEGRLNEKLAVSEKEIAAIKAKALSEVDGIATDTATEIVRQLVGGTATRADVAKAVAAAAKQ
ncbi:MAG: F0F1 ATP synthase subunit B [Nitratireductor sp.]|nr:F0F1 ATP synthase subunit B [Nitratireductor sp.]